MLRIPHSAMLASTGLSVLHTSFRVASKKDTACSTDAFGRTKRTKSSFGGTLVLVRCPTVPAPVLGLSDRFLGLLFYLVCSLWKPLGRVCFYLHYGTAITRLSLPLFLLSALWNWTKNLSFFGNWLCWYASLLLGATAQPAKTLMRRSIYTHTPMFSLTDGEPFFIEIFPCRIEQAMMLRKQADHWAD